MAQLEEDQDSQGSVEQTMDASGVPVIKIAGEIDIANAHVIGRRLERLIVSGTDRLVIDLSALAFMDSAGIAMLLRALAGVGSVTVRNPSSVVRRILECTGLTVVLPIEP